MSFGLLSDNMRRVGLRFFTRLPVHQTTRHVSFMSDLAKYRDAKPQALRGAMGDDHFTFPTAGLARGYAQCNVVILPQADAADFEAFCKANPQACPLIDKTLPGDPTPLNAAFGADLRIHVPRYRVFRHGVLEAEEPTNIKKLWRKDFVGFLLGCSFTFERALEAAGLEVRHVAEGKNVPMYRTNRACVPAGKFSGPLVVSMRPFTESNAALAREITSRYPRMHGAPVHIGDAAELGIADLSAPDFGEVVTIRPGEVPVFWACGVTSQVALENAGCEIAITHSPGRMFVTDLKDDSFRQ